SVRTASEQHTSCHLGLALSESETPCPDGSPAQSTCQPRPPAHTARTHQGRAGRSCSYPGFASSPVLCAFYLNCASLFCRLSPQPSFAPTRSSACNPQFVTQVDASSCSQPGSSRLRFQLSHFNFSALPPSSRSPVVRSQ